MSMGSYHPGAYMGGGGGGYYPPPQMMQVVDHMTGRVYNYMPGHEYEVRRMMERDRERIMGYRPGDDYSSIREEEIKKEEAKKAKDAEEKKKLEGLIAYYYNEGKVRN